MSKNNKKITNKITNTERLIKLEQENKYQTKTIEDIKQLMVDHIKSSEPFRMRSVRNTTHIFWMKIIGGGFFTIIIILVAILLKKLI